jgi:hypothetical protein
VRCGGCGAECAVRRVRCGGCSAEGAVRGLRCGGCGGRGGCRGVGRAWSVRVGLACELLVEQEEPRHTRGRGELGRLGLRPIELCSAELDGLRKLLRGKG